MTQLTPGGTPPDGVPAHKRSLRAELLAHRRSVGEAERSGADQAVRDLVRTLVKPGMVVTGYAPTPGEPGGIELPAVLAEAVGEDGQLLLPIVLPDLDLDWAVYTGDEHLELARLGLREPTGPRLGTAAISQADLVVAPGLAVDRQGVRLGRGGGCYDRALTRVRPGTPIVALLYDGELLPSLPEAPHDRRVTAVITPSGLVQV